MAATTDARSARAVLCTRIDNGPACHSKPLRARMTTIDRACHASTTAAAQITARRHAGGSGSAPRVRVTAHVTLACAATPASASSTGMSDGNSSPSGFREGAHDGAPERLRLVGRQVAVDVGRVVRHLSERPRTEPMLAQCEVRQQERHGRARHDRRRRAQRRPRSQVLPQPAAGHLVDHVRGHERHEVEQEVAAGPVLRHQRRRSAGERPGAARVEVAPEAVQRERHPLRRHHLQVRELPDPVRRERVEQAGHETRARAPGQLAHEQKRPETREDEGRQEQQVVRQDDVARERVDGEDLQHLRRQMLGVRERQRFGVEDVRVEVAAERAEVPAEEAEPVIGAPLQDPAVQHRIAEVPGDIAGEARREGPGQGQRGRGIQEGGGNRARPGLGTSGGSGFGGRAAGASWLYTPRPCMAAARSIRP